jgi:hypothetical protein
MTEQTVQCALMLAFEAGKWVGQVELEEHLDRQQYSAALLEVFYSEKITMPISTASSGRTVQVNLRSQQWRDGVRKSANKYLEKALQFAVSAEVQA